MAYSAERRRREREIKEALLEALKHGGATPDDVAEWLWEDFGKRVKPSWDRIKRAVMDGDVTPQDLVSLLDELGIEYDDEEIWRREYEALRGRQRNSESY